MIAFRSNALAASTNSFVKIVLGSKFAGTLSVCLTSLVKTAHSFVKLSPHFCWPGGDGTTRTAT